MVSHKEMPTLDLLRSIAVILVVIEHTLLAMRIFRIGYWNIAWLGVVGVFMFFVHTSLVLMWSMDRDSNPLGFYIRRIFRIYPLAVCSILFTVALRIPTLQNPLGEIFFQTRGVKNVIANLLIVQNLGWGGNILGVMWTLPLEIDMYFLLPFLYFFLRKNFAVWPVLALWCAAAAYGRANFPPDNPSFVVCIPYFLPGVIAYVLFARVRPRLAAWLMPVLVAILLCVFMIRPSWRAGWALTLVLGFALPFFRQVRATWLVKASHSVAQYSYGVYLIHPFCISLALLVFRNYSLAVQLSVLVGSLAASVFVAHHAIEKPMMNLGARLARANRNRVERSASMTPEGVAVCNQG